MIDTRVMDSEIYHAHEKLLTALLRKRQEILLIGDGVEEITEWIIDCFTRISTDQEEVDAFIQALPRRS